MHSHCLPASRPPCTDKEPNPATTVRWDGLVFSPPTKREGVKKKGGYGSCFGLSTFHLEAVKWDPQLPAEGTEAGQYPFFPPLIHAPCSFTNACTFVSPPPQPPPQFPHQLVTCYIADMNAMNSIYISSAPLHAVTLTDTNTRHAPCDAMSPQLQGWCHLRKKKT